MGSRPAITIGCVTNSQNGLYGGICHRGFQHESRRPYTPPRPLWPWFWKAPMRVPSAVVLVAFKGVGAVSAFTGVAMLFLVEHRGPDEFVYFTVQSNLLVGFCFLWATLARLLPRHMAEPQAFLRGAVTLYVLVTFLVFHLVLANPASGFGDGSVQLGPVQNVLLHTVTPLLALLDWLLVGVEWPRWRWAAVWLIYPVAYLLFVLVRGVIVHGYPYPFLDVTSLGY